jgi:MinD superfamily P-loop ATPase
MIRELVVLSGKGGTGKTSLTGAFAMLAENCLLCDADVDAADLHLLLSPEKQSTTAFMGGSLAVVRKEDCTGCGRCLELCRFHAVSEDFTIDPLSCEGCGLCVDLCPEKAIDFPVQQCGEWFRSVTRFGPMVHARLGIAEENSGKLVSLVRKEARELAGRLSRDLILTDGPPGIGCPVIASISGASALVIIVEPTVSGLHDLRRVVELASSFKVAGMICVNKFDLNPEITKKIEAFAAERQIKLVGNIPFDPVFVKAMVAAQNILEYAPDSKAAAAVKNVWRAIEMSTPQGQGIIDFNQVIQ